MKTSLRARAVLRCALSLALVAPALCAAQADGLKPRPSQLPVPEVEPVMEKSYSIPAMEIVGFDFLLNRYNHAFSGSPDYTVTLESIRRNLCSSWAVDSDDFHINQLGHPYQGSMYYGFARSAGLGFWESAGYTFAGSIGWELFGENTRPSVNDQIASGIGGTFLGESLFRMASLLLEHGEGVPRPMREVAAAAISPSTGFNRLVYGKRFDTIFASRNPAYYSRLQLGLMGTAQNEQGISTLLKRNEAQANFSMEYGLPGKDGYHYSRPFDYFAFEATGSSANVFETVMTRGLLAGGEYSAAKDRYRGIWGLYGSYDYISPQTFRVSSTALSLGTTGQWRASDRFVVQGSVMAGIGYSAVGTVHGGTERDYHYGTTPQALVALRLIDGDRTSLDLTAREYFVTHATNNAPGGNDNITRAEISLTHRLHKLHAITIKYLWNRRIASFPGIEDSRQTRGTVGIFYTLLGQDRFGTVDWR
ncbi:DUF3943 domain-containing protein [Caenimonas terrae]|uniref:DUF3943 domain-containing protein n=1 Tax=Caenimonas terrae TaxID=696074 RepID=A0ABW0NCC8_9BURK